MTKLEDVVGSAEPTRPVPGKPARSLLARVYAWIGGFPLAVTILALLAYVTWRGTLYQVEHGLYEAQKAYFDSFGLIDRFKVFGLKLGIPMLGGVTLMGALMVNLLVGGFIRIRKSTATIGILVAHTGIVLLIVAGLVKFVWSTDGYMQVNPHQTAGEYISYTDWQFDVIEPLAEGNERRFEIPEEDFPGLGSPRTFRHAGLPFELTLINFTRNALVRPGTGGVPGASDGRVVDGFRVVALKPAVNAEQNLAAIYAVLREKKSGKTHEAILWGGERAPYAVEIDGKVWGLELRHKRWPLPFDVRLDKFSVVWHPGTRRPKSFESEISVLDDGAERPVHIEMNQPLRYKGYVLFQTNWGPQDPSWRGEYFSVFSVVDNLADSWPEWACWVIAAGLLIHFGAKLLGWVSKESKRATKLVQKEIA